MHAPVRAVSHESAASCSVDCEYQHEASRRNASYILFGAGADSDRNSF